MLNLEDVKDELPTYHFLYRLIFRLVKCVLGLWALDFGFYGDGWFVW